MIYLTFNDAPGGIYYSQVTDVVQFLRSEFQTRIRLVAFVSLRKFASSRKKIKLQEPTAVVIPMFPGVAFWKCNLPALFVLSFLFNFNEVIARGPYATYFALFLKKLKRTGKVCFDARGAYDAEFNEYNIIDNKRIKNEIKIIEQRALNESNYRIAVSHGLIDYWKEQYKYTGTDHVVIPCTLNSPNFRNFPDETTLLKNREALHIKSNEIVLVYSGSSSGWQSLEMLDALLIKLMDKDPDIKIIFLVEKMPNALSVQKKYSGRILHKWLAPDEVNQILMAADYGILIREKSVTNKVSSPVKFAEYLSSGLSVLISDEIGDYTRFVEEHKCGIVIKNENIALSKKNYAEKLKSNDLARQHFTKLSNKENYFQLIKALKGS